MKTYVTADCHGNYKGLKQCLELCNFDYENDKLIFLGDICDGLPDVDKCFEELLKIKNLIMLKANHDEWALSFYMGHMGFHEEPHWRKQGGEMTLKAYGYKPMTSTHLALLKRAKLYHVEETEDGDILFVHGGINLDQKDITKQKLDFVTWDRTLITIAKRRDHQKPRPKLAGYKTIYVGHTPTQLYKTMDPLKFCNVQMLDTGGGWNGKITVMNINTNEFWQSDLVRDLYPNYSGRG